MSNHQWCSHIHAFPLCFISALVSPMSLKVLWILNGNLVQFRLATNLSVAPWHTEDKAQVLTILALGTCPHFLKLMLVPKTWVASLPFPFPLPLYFLGSQSSWRFLVARCFPLLKRKPSQTDCLYTRMTALVLLCCWTSFIHSFFIHSFYKHFFCVYFVSGIVLDFSG